MLKTTTLPKSLISIEIGDSEGGDGVGGMVIAKKSGKLKGQKILKSQKLAKFKKLLKSGNLSNLNANNSGLSFLTPEARSAFNHL